ncbi:YceI family protein [Salsipaludibacter albus]|uniref:YceI family protein n=1 Tax=Salsipaludibacter albus TaxID=2849650 RepID=UPI001EE3B254|nr:YceI family protein [Salsipaludibacter albus]MBY5162164.1 YceI family protein [Salsipaludibacter albus]
MSTTTATPTLTGEYVLDDSHSRLGFVARHAMVTKVRGSFSEFSASGHFDPENPGESNAAVTIQAASIDTGNEDRDTHLRSNDFFDMENHPEIRFTSTDVTKDGDVFNVTGDLTIKGTTKSVTIPFEFTGAATDPFGNERVGFEGSVQVNRKDWDLNWNAPLNAGGVLVSDKVTLELDLSAIKQDS